MLKQLQINRSRPNSGLVSWVSALFLGALGYSLLMASTPLGAQTPVSTPTSVPTNIPTSTAEVPEGEVAAGFESGVGTLRLPNGEARLGYTLTLTGDMFSLQPLVVQLGGTLELGPLGQSHTLDLFGNVIVIGPGSPVMTIDDRIVPLSRTPLAGTGGLMVPLDFLRRTWGEFSGYSFTWARASRTLVVERRAARELEMDLRLVNIAGMTTLVMRFVEDPMYRYQPTEDGFEVVFPGDELLLRGGLPRPVDMIEDVTLDHDRVRVKLAPGAVAEEPYRVDRERIQVLVNVVNDGSRTSAVSRPRLPNRARSNTMRIVLDPGHGGEEVGAVGTRGTLEKDLTLGLAKRLRRRLESRLPVRVLMTREKDIAVPLETRTAMANQNEADLFISLHMNSVPGGGGRGAETYFLNLEASDRRAEESARIENRSSSGGGSDGLDLMLWDLAQSQHMAASQAFGRLVQRELNQALEVRDRGVKQAPFAVLVGATMPAVLVEFGFLSDPDEEAKLQRAEYQDALVEAVVRAVSIFRESRLRRTRGAARAEQKSAEQKRSGRTSVAGLPL